MNNKTNQKENFFVKYWPYIMVIIFTLIIEIPQLISGHIIIGSDTYFHYNRFYDAAMQIKHANITYFPMYYGFNQCGRIVNAIYSPYFAYFNGLLLLICHSYFRYQIASDVLVDLGAAIGLSIGFKIAKIKTPASKFLIMFYPFTYQVVHWDISNNFTSCGAIVIPLAIGCAVKMLDQPKHPINTLELGIITALVVQIHLVTALEMVIMYLIIVPIAFFKNPYKKSFFKHLFWSAFLALILDLNIIAGLIETFGSNSKINPLMHESLRQERIFNIKDFAQGRFMSTVVFFIVLIILLAAITVAKNDIKIIGLLSLIFYVLSSNILPWAKIFSAVHPLSVIQYPSRFLVLAVSLSMFFMAMIYKTDILANWLRILTEICICLFAAMSIFTNYKTVNVFAHKVAYSHGVRPMAKTPSQKRHHRKMIIKTSKSGDLKKMLYQTYSGTGDYLPLHKLLPYHDNPAAPGYWENMHYIVEPQTQHLRPRFRKTVSHHVLKVTYNLKHSTKVLLPIAKYSNTIISIDHNPLYEYNPKYKHLLNLPEIKLNPGHHTIYTAYVPSLLSKTFVHVSTIAWIAAFIIYGLVQGLIWQKKHPDKDKQKQQEDAVRVNLLRTHY